MKKTSTFLFVFFISIISDATDAGFRTLSEGQEDSLPAVLPQSRLNELCPDRLLGFENIQLGQQRSLDQKTCFLSLTPRNAHETLIYRDYLFTNEGLMMVFNSLSPEQTSTSHGAREFFFFPQPFSGFQWRVEEGSLVVEGFQGRVMKFDLQTAQITSLSGAEIKVESKVHGGNRGGVEILASDFLFVDAGFRLGNSPSADRSRSSVLKNPKGQKCQLRNTQVFDYLEEEASLKLKEALKRNVLRACPEFEI